MITTYLVDAEREDLTADEYYDDNDKPFCVVLWLDITISNSCHRNDDEIDAVEELDVPVFFIDFDHIHPSVEGVLLVIRNDDPDASKQMSDVQYSQQ